MKDINQLKKITKELFDTQRLAVLSTNNKGQSYSNLIAFSASDDLKTLIFATSRSTRKYANIIAESRGSLLTDNRSYHFMKYRNQTGSMSEGNALPNPAWHTEN